MFGSCTLSLFTSSLRVFMNAGEPQQPVLESAINDTIGLLEEAEELGKNPAVMCMNVYKWIMLTENLYFNFQLYVPCYR